MSEKSEIVMVAVEEYPKVTYWKSPWMDRLNPPLTCTNGETVDWFIEQLKGTDGRLWPCLVNPKKVYPRYSRPLFIVDGYHRHAAMRILGFTEIPTIWNKQ